MIQLFIRLFLNKFDPVIVLPLNHRPTRGLDKRISNIHKGYLFLMLFLSAKDVVISELEVISIVVLLGGRRADEEMCLELGGPGDGHWFLAEALEENVLDFFFE